jgi:hypothetical protein
MEILVSKTSLKGIQKPARDEKLTVNSRWPQAAVVATRQYSPSHLPAGLRPRWSSNSVQASRYCPSQIYKDSQRSQRCFPISILSPSRRPFYLDLDAARLQTTFERVLGLPTAGSAAADKIHQQISCAAMADPMNQ